MTLQNYITSEAERNVSNFSLEQNPDGAKFIIEKSVKTSKGIFAFTMTTTIGVKGGEPFIERVEQYSLGLNQATPIEGVEVPLVEITGWFKRDLDGKDTISHKAYKIEGFNGLFMPMPNGYLMDTYAIGEDEHITLNDGSFLMKKYGKYEPNICFLSTYPYVVFKDVDYKEFNLDKCSLRAIRGDFFISKRGTKCFRIKKDGKHLLLEDRWGGAFNTYRGHTLPQDQLYYRRASSNGGGCGVDYAVVPIGWKSQLSEEDI